MRYVLYALAGLYGLLHIYVPIVGMTKMKMKKDALLIMLLGALLLLSAVLVSMFGKWSWVPALAGCILISLAAFINGGREGGRHRSHHIIRAIVHVLLVFGFVFL